jgi:hypothetical protein
MDQIPTRDSSSRQPCRQAAFLLPCASQSPDVCRVQQVGLKYIRSLCRRSRPRSGCVERVCCLWVLNSVTSTLQWIRQPWALDVHPSSPRSSTSACSTWRATFIRRDASSAGFLATSFGGLHHLTGLSTHPLLPFSSSGYILFCIRDFHVRCSRTQTHSWRKMVTPLINGRGSRRRTVRGRLDVVERERQWQMAILVEEGMNLVFIHGSLKHA